MDSRVPLHEIAERYRELRAFRDVEPFDPETGEVLTDADVRAELAAIDALLGEKAEAVCYRIDELKGQSAALKEIEARASARRKARDARVLALRGYLFGEMKATGIERIAAKLHTVSIVAGKPKVLVENPAELPGTYWDQTVSGEVLETVEMLLLAIGEEAEGLIGEIAAHLRSQMTRLDPRARSVRLGPLGKALEDTTVPGAGLIDGEDHLQIR